MYQATNATGSAEKMDRRQLLTLLTLGLGLAIVIIDATIVNVAIPSIAKDFGATLQDLEWVNSIYSLIFAAFIITWGRVGDQVGNKRIFVAGVSVFVLGSLGAGISQNTSQLILARVVQGMGAAMTSPTTLSIISTAFTGRMRGVAFGVWGGIAGAAGALGPLLGGWLITNASWRWAFLINLPIGIIAILGAWLLISETRTRQGKLTFDVPGIILIAVGVGSIVFGLIEGQTHGWWAPKAPFTLGGFTWPLTTIAITPFVFALGIVALALFTIWEIWLQRRGGDPLFDFTLLRFRGFRFGLITVSIVALGEFGVIFVLSIYLQTVIGLSAFGTGVAFLPFAIATFFAAPTAGLLSARFGAKWVVTSGMVLEATAIFVLSLVIGVTLNRAAFLLVLMLYGAGVGLAIGQLTNVVLSEIPYQQMGVASGANNTVRQVGASLGIAIIGAVFTAMMASAAASGVDASTLLPPPVKTAIVQAVDTGNINASQFSSGQGQGQGAQAEALGQEIKRVVDESLVAGVQASARMAGFFVLLGAISSLFIPKAPASRQSAAAPDASSWNAQSGNQNPQQNAGGWQAGSGNQNPQQNGGGWQAGSGSQNPQQNGGGWQAGSENQNPQQNSGQWPKS